MAKIITNTKTPSRAQSRLLKSIQVQEGKVNIWYGRSSTSKPTAFAFIGMIEPKPKPRIETIMTCVKNKWLKDETVERAHKGNRIVHRTMVISEQGEHVLAIMPEEHFKLPKSYRDITAAIVNALANKYTQPEWAFLDELAARTGHASQRIDAWAIHCWPSSGYERIAFEIKVSRSDWIKELDNPLKRERAKTIANRFFFVCPANMIKLGECPEDAGLVYWHPDSDTMSLIKKAPDLEVNNVPTWAFVAAIARRYAKVRYPTESVAIETEI